MFWYFWNPQEEPTKLIGWDKAITVKREPKHTENDQLLSLYIFLASYFTIRPMFRLLLLIYTILRASKDYWASSNTNT